MYESMGVYGRCKKHEKDGLIRLIAPRRGIGVFDVGPLHRRHGSGTRRCRVRDDDDAKLHVPNLLLKN